MKRTHVIYSHVRGGVPEWHIQADALEIVKMEWDMVIAFPPCTHLAVSGARHFKQKKRNGKQQMGVGFFLAFTVLDHVPMVAIENPIGIMSNLYRKPDQIIQPYEYGHETKKSTCLWLKGLPNLIPTKIVEPEIIEYKCKNGKVARFGKGIGEAVDENGKAYAFNDPLTAKLRSKTFPGIAKAMAEQWGVLEKPYEREEQVTIEV